MTGVDSNARFDWHDFLEDAPCGYISLLINGRIEYVNRTFLNW